MGNILTICSKEVRSYFTGPIAYLLMGLFGLIFGFYFYSASVSFINYGLRQQMSGQMQPMNVNEMVIAPMLGFASVLSLFLMPLISMRLFAEEKRSGTMELLLTSPIGDWEIILGKWLGALVMYVAVLATALINLAFLFAYGNPDWRPLAIGLLGLILQTGTLLAIGTFISTTTKNQIIAGGATFAVCLLLWILSWVGQYSETWVGQAIAYCAIPTHYEPFSKGIMDTKDVVYYLSTIFLGLFLTARSLESLRWRA